MLYWWLFEINMAMTIEEKRARNREYMKKYYAEKKQQILEYQAGYYKKNSEKVKTNAKKWKESNKEHVDEYNRQYRKEHTKEHSEYIKKRRSEDSKYNMICSVRNMINNAFRKRMGYEKTKHCEEVLGCTLDEFVEHLESLFQEGMTLENHGEWHIDHIIPLSSAKTEEEVIKLNHYTNLQPMWAKDNIRKGNKIN